MVVSGGGEGGGGRFCLGSVGGELEEGGEVGNFLAWCSTFFSFPSFFCVDSVPSLCGDGVDVAVVEELMECGVVGGVVAVGIGGVGSEERGDGFLCVPLVCTDDATGSAF